MNVLAVFLLIITSMVGNAQQQSEGVPELETRFKGLKPVEQQLVILERLPEAVDAPEEFAWLTSRLSADLLDSAQGGKIAHCLLRLDRKLTTTPGARQRQLIVASRDPSWVLGERLRQIIVNDIDRFDREYEGKQHDGRLAHGEEDVIRELVAWGRMNGTAPDVLSTVEGELNAFAGMSADTGLLKKASPSLNALKPLDLRWLLAVAVVLLFLAGWLMHKRRSP